MSTSSSPIRSWDNIDKKLEQRFLNYAETGKWSGGKIAKAKAKEVEATRDAIKKCHLTYGNRHFFTQKKIPCSCTWHDKLKAKNAKATATAKATTRPLQEADAEDGASLLIDGVINTRPSSSSSSSATAPSTATTNTSSSTATDTPAPAQAPALIAPSPERNPSPRSRVQVASIFATAATKRLATTTNTNAVHVPFNFPYIKPKPRGNASEVKGTQHWPQETKDHYPLQTFCPNNGKCKCGSSNIEGGDISKTVRPILCHGLPRFVQSQSMTCVDCNERTMAYEKTYVDTLPSRQTKSKLDAIIIGNSHGIDMSLIRALRNGTSAEEIENTARANLYALWSTSKETYKEKCESLRKMGHAVHLKEFPAFPEEYVPKADQLNKAFLRDFATEEEWLKRELAVLKTTTTTLAIDNQVKVVKSAKAGSDKSPRQTLSVVGDCGIILAHVVVGSDSKMWSDPCIKEVVARHDTTPKVCFVDKNCCNGKLGGRTEETKMLCGMEKKLDVFHVMKRIGETINSEHKRAATFKHELSECIFTCDTSDLAKLKSTKMKHPSTCGNLSQKKNSRDQSKHVKRNIESGEKVCSRIITLVVNQARNDKYAKEEYEQSPRYHPTTPITPSHVAYPLITKEVWKVIRQQLVHILNGCLSDDEYNMYVTQREINYRSTGDMLPLYTCLRGTNKVEAFNSVLALKSSDWHQIRPELFDARTLWILIHYNRKKLRTEGRSALPNGISPSEAGDDITLATVEDAKRIKFGFEYYDYVKDMMKLKGGIQLNDSNRHGDHNNNTFTFESNSIEYAGDASLDDIIVPDQVGIEDLGHLGEVLERKLPNVDDSLLNEKRATPSLPNVEKECSKLMAAYTIGSEEDAVKLLSKKRKRNASSSDIELYNRQKTAKATMIANGISTCKDTNKPGERKLCKVCQKNKDRFIFQSRKHIQINKKVKGVEVKSYCPLADPPETYYEVLKQREENKKMQYKRGNEKKNAKRRKS